MSDETRRGDLDEQDRRLRAEADALLSRHGIPGILREFGKPHVSGSYALRLMTWRDLDIYLELAAVDVPRFLALGLRLGEALRPRKLSFTDHVHFPATEPVAGLYWGVQTGALDAGGWKIDLWGATGDVVSERLSHCDSLAAALTPARRRVILAIKDEVCRLPAYRGTITSQDVYDAVIHGGASSTEDFWRYVRRGVA